jgi:hypothetical protein
MEIFEKDSQFPWVSGETLRGFILILIRSVGLVIPREVMLRGRKDFPQITPLKIRVLKVREMSSFFYLQKG